MTNAATTDDPKAPSDALVEPGAPAAAERAQTTDKTPDSDAQSQPDLAPEPGESEEPTLYGVDLIRKHGFWTIVKEDYRGHHSDVTLPGFQALFAYRFGTWRQKLKNPVFRLITKAMYSLMHRFVRNFYGIEMFDTTKIGRRLHIGHQHGIVLHGYGTIGDDCVVRQGVTMGVTNTWEIGVGPVIGNRVNFGAGCVLMGNITIGDDVMIGPNAVVSANVPSQRTVFAPPARVLPRQMDDES
ncbi:MAG: serine acetyltransferase [Pseudomonadota bacterium]